MSILSLKHRATIYRMTDFGSAGKRGYAKVKRVKCLIMPDTDGYSQATTHISQGYKGFFNTRAKVRVSDKIVSDHKEYIVSGVRTYKGYGAIDHLEASMDLL